MADKKKHELNKHEEMGVAQGDMPDFLRNSTGLGNEGVNTEDLVIPRLSIIQSQSPELDADDPTHYIEGCKQGQMFNTLTREVFDKILLVDCFYRKEFAVFVKRTAGGGFRGSYPSNSDAVAAVESSDKPMDLEIVETGLHFCLVVNPENNKVMGEVVVPMTSTKLKVSRAWNSQIRMRGGDRFAGMWYLVTKKEKNDKGTYYNFAVAPGPWVTKEIYETAKATYETIRSGKKDVERGGDTESHGEVDSDKF